MFEFSVSPFFTCHVLVKFSPLFSDHWLQRAGRGSRRSRGPRQWSHWWAIEEQTRGLNQDCYVSKKSTNVQANTICPKNCFYLIGIGICYFQNKPLCTFRQVVATLECLVRSSYPQLHGIVNLFQTLQGGLEIVLLSWRTFSLTDLHSAEHLCVRCDLFTILTVCEDVFPVRLPPHISGNRGTTDTS